MAHVTIPNRPTGSDPRSIAAILADFDAITTEFNGNVDRTNLKDEGVTYTKPAKGADGLARGSFSVYRAAAHSPVNGVASKVGYDTEEWDYGGYFDVAQARFTPLIAGVYRLSAFQRAITDTYLFLYVYKNGSIHRVLDGDYPSGAAAGADTSGVATASGSTLVTANGTTDYFEVWTQHGFSGALAYDVGATFAIAQGELVGRI